MKRSVSSGDRALIPSGWRSSGWFEWMDISETPNYEGCGVYKIRLTNSEGFPAEIPRFIDTDKDGILQICYSGNIKRGIYRFRGSIEGKKYTHAEGQRLQLLKKFTNLKERYKGCKMEYSFKKQASTREARVEQERLLKCYVKKYGEVPPNNNNFPDKHIDWESLPGSETTHPMGLPSFMYEMSSSSYRT
jgi:hypothetical protein